MVTSQQNAEAMTKAAVGRQMWKVASDPDKRVVPAGWKDTPKRGAGESDSK